jgi:chromatin segregation and condensation protein Rec8/ScpA/Scc1 (kleisin family)
LELIKQKIVVVKQAQVFGDIEIIRCMDEVKPVSGQNG